MELRILFLLDKLLPFGDEFGGGAGDLLVGIGAKFADKDTGPCSLSTVKPQELVYKDGQSKDR